MEDDFLKNFDKAKNPQKVPAGYFDKKKLDLLTIADKPTEEAPKNYTLKTTLSVLSGIAAAILIGFFVFKTGDTPIKNKAELPLTTASIESYLIQEYPASIVEEEIIIGELNSTDIEAMNFSAYETDELEFFLDNNFDQMLDYEYL
jgi:hypothetical protein